MDIISYMTLQAQNGYAWEPQIGESKNYQNWIAHLDFRTCRMCRNNHGKIWPIDENPETEPPLHLNCRCDIMPMKTVKAGTATINGLDGADWYLKYYERLPEYYVDKQSAYKSGWIRGKDLSVFMPAKMLSGKYYNSNKHLPQKQNREWYEADINYKSGKRNTQRILWSNDGLIFVTFDHYDTFFEIV